MQVASDQPLLRLRDVRTLLPTRVGAVHAVDGVTLDLHAGRTLAIVGESGSGKSVLARTIMGLTPRSAVTSGSIRFRGVELTALSPAEMRRVRGAEIAMVFQDAMTALNPVVRVRRQITESLREHRALRRSAARSRARALLEQVGIPDPDRRLSSYPHELSGGLRQRVCIAAALACSPRLLIADEPTTALDVTIQRQIMDLLGDLQAGVDMSMLLVSHDLALVAGRADEIAVMYAGQVIEYGPTRRVFRETRHPYTAALLASAPRLDSPSHAPLATIQGYPPKIVDPRPGCRFAPRCPLVQERCRREDPPVERDVHGHLHRCWFPMRTSPPDHGDGSTCSGASGSTPPQPVSIRSMR